MMTGWKRLSRVPVLIVLVGLATACSNEILGLGTSDPGELEILSMTADPDNIAVGSASLITVKTNQEGGLTYQWIASLGYFIGAGSQVRYSASSCCRGTNTITCVVSDSNDHKVSASVQVTVR